jgi:hypothetical protein
MGTRNARVAVKNPRPTKNEKKPERSVSANGYGLKRTTTEIKAIVASRIGVKVGVHFRAAAVKRTEILARTRQKTMR